MREVYSDVILKCLIVIVVILILLLIAFILGLYILEKVEERKMKKNEIRRKNM